MRDLRRMATAIEAYKFEQGFYPVVDTIEDLVHTVFPRYMKSLPVKDVYGNEYKYQAWQEDAALPGPDNYAIGCSGKDGEWEHADLRDYEQGPVHNIKADLIFRNRYWVQWLEGPYH